MIFILLDKPDENLDMALSEHVLAMHSGEGWLTAEIDKKINK